MPSWRDAAHDGWLLVVYICFITAAGNSISSQLGSSCQGNRYGAEKAGSRVRPSCTKSCLLCTLSPSQSGGQHNTTVWALDQPCDLGYIKLPILMALSIIDFIGANGLLGPVGWRGPWTVDTPGPKWHLLCSLPFKGPGVSRAPSPPLAHVIHSTQ
jgi:hypothetical protein